MSLGQLNLLDSSYQRKSIYTGKECKMNLTTTTEGWDSRDRVAGVGGGGGGGHVPLSPPPQNIFRIIKS